ncbi:transaldolase [Auraticoccus sp. F435]|uniref:Transaldolase n=1 Tax=Auraticoccus cholistanensis TaxID=2656650 RepID=A0A6A9UYX6_9ACTN|nr:transaldolase family protein [Auraticoccus cholistanensis]MVA77185.1 transaldolase [Auraticoccus cholistanensis]
MTEQFPQTALWNDSIDPVELRESLGWGAVGATCNPVIALAAIRADLPRWQRRLRELAEELPTATESQLGWRVVEELTVEGARLLEPVFAAQGGRNGRVSVQTDPRLFRDPEALVRQAVHFSGLAPNVIVKIPATPAGIVAIEEATARGVSINATVSFTVAQAVAVAEAVERGIARRGGDDSELGSVATIMGGRLDDWLRTCASRTSTLLPPGYLDWAGVATLKRAHEIFQARGYRTRVLAAAFRNHLPLTELVGGDLVISPPTAWQRAVNAADLPLESRIDVPVAPEVVETLTRLVPEFSRAYEPDGLAVAEFGDFGATRHTLRQFLAADADLDALVRDLLVPAP